MERERGKHGQRRVTKPSYESSRFRGVTLDDFRGTRRWRAQIRFAGQVIRLGSFAPVPDPHRGVDWGEVAPAFAYDLAALELHGQGAIINFPLEPGRPDSVSIRVG